MQCSFIQCADTYRWACVYCHRQIANVSIVEHGLYIMRQECGIESQYDVKQWKVNGEPQIVYRGAISGRQSQQPIEHQRYVIQETACQVTIVPFVPMRREEFEVVEQSRDKTNELLGQEGGQWDEFYRTG